jgi:uncharacterized protein
MVIVSNTSPISNLVLIGEISLLQQIYPKVLINAKQQGLIPILKPTLDRLIDRAGFRVSQALYNRTLQEVGE